MEKYFVELLGSLGLHPLLIIPIGIIFVLVMAYIVKKVQNLADKGNTKGTTTTYNLKGNISNSAVGDKSTVININNDNV